MPPEVFNVWQQERIFKWIFEADVVADCRTFRGTHLCVESGNGSMR